IHRTVAASKPHMTTKNLSGYGTAGPALRLGPASCRLHGANFQDYRKRRSLVGGLLDAAAMPVFYGAEGGLGIEERLTALRMHHKTDFTDVPLPIIAEPLDLPLRGGCSASGCGKTFLALDLAAPCRTRLELA